MMPICTVEGCDKPKRSAELCKMHYARMTRTGFTQKRCERRVIGSRVLLSNGHIADIDAEDAQVVSQFLWHETSEGYVATTTGATHRSTKTLYLHRLLLNAARGVRVDHADRNPLNNRKSNLRVCTQSQNLANRPAQRFRKSEIYSTYKGVSFHRAAKKWIAQIQCKGERRYKLVQSEHAAAAWYNQQAIDLFGEFAGLNSLKGTE